jgi:arginine/serine-rich coiled-coil protein 2
VAPSVSSADSSKAKPNQWNGLKFEGEKGTEMTEKFRKLMGIKDKDLSAEEALATKNESAIESQETLFRNLDLQYSIARLSTHTQRGVGLGFGGPQK